MRKQAQGCLAGASQDGSTEAWSQCSGFWYPAAGLNGFCLYCWAISLQDEPMLTKSSKD